MVGHRQSPPPRRTRPSRRACTTRRHRPRRHGPRQSTYTRSCRTPSTSSTTRVLSIPSTHSRPPGRLRLRARGPQSSAARAGSQSRTSSNKATHRARNLHLLTLRFQRTRTRHNLSSPPLPLLRDTPLRPRRTPPHHPRPRTHLHSSRAPLRPSHPCITPRHSSSPRTRPSAPRPHPRPLRPPRPLSPPSSCAAAAWPLSRSASPHAGPRAPDTARKGSTGCRR